MRAQVAIEQRAGGHYLVRTYDLVRGELVAGAVVDKREPDEPMEGEPVARAVPAAAPWSLHVYRKASGPFVHALNTDGFALCIDLPATARSGAAAALGFVLSPDASTLYAANPALGLVVEIAARDAAQVRRTARIPRGAIGVAPRLAVPHGATLYVPTAVGVAAVDTGNAGDAAHAAARPSGERGGHQRGGACTRAGRRRSSSGARRGERGCARRVETSAPPAALAAVLPAR